MFSSSIKTENVWRRLRVWGPSYSFCEVINEILIQNLFKFQFSVSAVQSERQTFLTRRVDKDVVLLQSKTGYAFKEADVRL